MARPLRIEYPGAFYHVLNRGNAGERLFLKTGEKEKFLEYIGKAVERFSIRVHAYCLMANHYHLLIETPRSNLSAAIQWLNVSYATYYNKKHQRLGHLFQGRFKALLVDADEYLKELSRYIHLNPVRAKLVAKPMEYKWSSYHCYISESKACEWLETSRLLGYFGAKRKDALRNYQNFVENIDVNALENPFRNAAGGFILGGKDFVSWVKDTFLSDGEAKKEIPQLTRLKPRVPVEKVLETVCEEIGSSEDEIRSKGGKRNMGREIAIYLSRDLSGASGNYLGEFFGGVTGAAITMSCNQLSKKISKDRKLRGKISRIKKRLFNF